MNIDSTPAASNLEENIADGKTTTGIKKWIPLFVMSLALTIMILDTTILNVTLRKIIEDLHTTIQNIQWVITGYSLTLAAFTITGGRLGDLFGRKKMFVWGAIIFAIGSFITAISTSVNMMIAGEAIIEGIGAALMMPATASLLRVTYTGRDRSIAFGIWGGIVAGAAALGPVIGGWLSTSYSWRWAFLINIGVAAILVIASTLIKESRGEKTKPSLDIMGAILSAFGMFFIIFGLIQSSTYGWLYEKAPFLIFEYTISLGGLSVVPFFLLAGIIILIIFGLWENNRLKIKKTPLVSLKLFKNRQFLSGASITGILALGQAGLSFSVPLFLQSVRNLDPLQTGIAMIPMTAVILIAAPFSSFLSKFITPKRIIQLGILCDITGFLVLMLSLNTNANEWSLAPGLALFGFGMGTMMAQTSNVTLSAVPPREAGEASGVNSTLRMVGSTLGSAVIGAVMLGAMTSNIAQGFNQSNIIPDHLKKVIIESTENQASSMEYNAGNTLSNGIKLPENIQKEITSVVHQATVDANKSALNYGIIFLIAALLISTLLPNKKAAEIEKK